MKIKKLFKRVFLVSITFLITLIAYFEIDNYVFESKLRKMEENNELLMVGKESVEEHKALQIDGCEIHYYLSGKQSEKSIVFLHPAFSDHRAFDQQIDFFSKDYKVISIDLIGHGLSKANKSKDKIDTSPEHILKILESEGIEETNLVGVSVGSLIAQYFALKYPSRVKSLTALGGYNINRESKEIEKFQRNSNLGLIFRAVFSISAFRKKAASLTCKSKIGQAIFYETTSHHERKSFMVMSGLQNVVKNRGSIKTDYPTLIMVGEFDIELAKKMTKKWCSDLENYEYYLIENAGHCANIDRPHIFNKKVKEFIDKSN